MEHFVSRIVLLHHKSEQILSQVPVQKSIKIGPLNIVYFLSKFVAVDKGTNLCHKGHWQLEIFIDTGSEVGK